MPDVEINGAKFSVDELTDRASGAVFLVCVPPGASQDIVCILGEEPQTLLAYLGAAHAAHEAVKDKEKRNWHPVLTIVGVKSLPASITSDPAAYANFIQSMLPNLLSKFGKPFGAGRALVARTGTAAAVLRSVLAAEQSEVTKLYRYYLVGDCGDGVCTATTPFPDKTQVFLSAAGAGEAAARALEGALLKRTGGGTDRTMFVTRDGEQTYTNHERIGPPPVTLELVAETGQAAEGSAFVAASMAWVGERFEAQKLKSLGSLLPWHEFK